MSKDVVNTAIDATTGEAIAKLGEVVSIKSVSGVHVTRGKVVEMANWLKKQLTESYPHSKAWFVPVEGKQQFPDGVEVDFPPLVFAEVGDMSKDKKTVLIYAHYDVQPAETSDGWDTDPWQLTTIGTEMRGRGATDDKGPLIGWLHVISQYAKCEKDLPVNLKFVLEGMEESGSIGFDETVEAHAKANPEWWSSVDYCVVSDNYWLTTEKPCLSYGLRGLETFALSVEGPAVDLHSGIYSGAVYQPMDDLLHVLSTLKNEKDAIAIEGVYDEVAPVTPEEEATYDKLTFSPEEFCKEIGIKEGLSASTKDLLMGRWRQPTLSVHGIEGAYSEPGFKTVIPRKVIAKFSIRTVPNQTSPYLIEKVKAHVAKVTANYPTANKISIEHLESGTWFYVDPSKSEVFKAAHKAIEEVWNVEPNYTREGGSIPITLTLSKLTGKDLCLLPMGRSNDGAHSQNEKLDIDNFTSGMKVFAAFLENLA